MFFVKNRKTQHPVKMANISIRNWLAWSPASRALNRVLRCWGPGGHLQVKAFPSEKTALPVEGWPSGWDAEVGKGTQEEAFAATYWDDTGLTGQKVKKESLVLKGWRRHSFTGSGPQQSSFGFLLSLYPSTRLFSFYDPFVNNRSLCKQCFPPSTVNSKEKPDLRLKC